MTACYLSNDSDIDVERCRISMRRAFGSLQTCSSRREAGRQRLEACTQRDVQAVGQEGDEDMRLDAVLELMMDRALVFHSLEGGLDLDELDIEPPQLRRLPPSEIGAQQIAAFAPPHLAQLVAIEREAETGALGSDLNIDQTPCRPCSGARGAELHEQFLDRGPWRRSP